MHSRLHVASIALTLSAALVLPGCYPGDAPPAPEAIRDIRNGGPVPTLKEAAAQIEQLPAVQQASANPAARAVQREIDRQIAEFGTLVVPVMRKWSTPTPGSKVEQAFWTANRDAAESFLKGARDAADRLDAQLAVSGDAPSGEACRAAMGSMKALLGAASRLAAEEGDPRRIAPELDRADEDVRSCAVASARAAQAAAR